MLEWLKDFTNTWGTLINIIGGGLGFVLTALLGGGFFYSLVQKWVKQAEKDRDEKSEELRQCREDLAITQKALSKANNEVELLTSKLLLISKSFDGPSDNLWLREPVIQPKDYAVRLPNSIPIILIANLKGGVGKTTLAANLAAYFEVKHDERVLAIDLDYQGSLSSMLLSEEDNRKSRDALCLKKLLEGTAGENAVLAYSKQMRGSRLGSRVLECDDPFANFETRLLIEWLTGDVAGDIRYNLARALCSDEVQGQFDRVIIDAPPRLTTGFISALCASTHLVVPFVLDILSAERVGLFLNSVKQMRGQLFPHLNLAAAIGTMKGDNTNNLRDAEKLALEEARRRIRENWPVSGEYASEKWLLPRKQAIADVAGVSIAYHEGPQIQRIFDPIGDVIYSRTGQGRARHENQRIETSAGELRRRSEVVGVERVR